MELPLAENGIFPSFIAPKVGVTPKCSFRAGLTAHASLDTLAPPFSFSASATVVLHVHMLKLQLINRQRLFAMYFRRCSVE